MGKTLKISSWRRAFLGPSGGEVVPLMTSTLSSRQPTVYKPMVVHKAYTMKYVSSGLREGLVTTSSGSPPLISMMAAAPSTCCRQLEAAAGGGSSSTDSGEDSLLPSTERVGETIVCA
jgi:hypothetical protein